MFAFIFLERQKQNTDPNLTLGRFLIWSLSILSFGFYGNFVSYCKAVLSSRAVCFLILAITFFNCSQEFPGWHETIQSNLAQGPAKGSSRSFPTAKGYLECPLLIYFISPMPALPHLLHNPEGSFVVFELWLEKNIVSRNALFTIPFKVTLFPTIETPDILIFLQTLEITSAIHASSWSWHSIFIVSWSHSSNCADLAFKGLVIILYWELAFSESLRFNYYLSSFWI